MSTPERPRDPWLILDLVAIAAGVASVCLLVDRALIVGAGRHLVTRIESWLDDLESSRPRPDNGGTSA